MIVNQAKRLDHVQEYYFSKKLREVAQMNAEGKDVINLGIGKPDLPPPSSVIKALQNSSEKASHHGYQSYSGIPELRNEFASWYSRYFKTTLDPKTEILPLIGSKEGIMHITMSFLEKGEQVLVPNPGYPAYSSAALLSGAESIWYNLTKESNWLPDLDELRSLDTSKVKIMWINYPHMPTGARANESIFKSLVEFCTKRKILLCHDNPYSFILNDNPFSILSIEGAKECAVELNSLSKSHNMSGWRVGMLAGKGSYISTVLKFKSNMDSGMFRAVQDGAIAALKAPDSWYNALTNTYQIRKKAAQEIADLLNCSYDYDQSGMFLWAEIPNTFADAIALADAILYGAKVFLTPGSIFGSNGNKYIRISLCQPLEVINNAKERISSFFKNRQIIEAKQSTL